MAIGRNEIRARGIPSKMESSMADTYSQTLQSERAYIGGGARRSRKGSYELK